MHNLEKYRLTFEFASVGIVHVRPDGRILEANPKFCQLLGRSREELIQYEVSELTHPDDRQKTSTAFSLLNSGTTESHSAEKRYLRKDGSYFWASLNTRVIMG